MTTYIRILAEIVIPVGWSVDDNGVPHGPSAPELPSVALALEDDEEEERVYADLRKGKPPTTLPLHHDVPPDQANVFPPMILIYPPALNPGEDGQIFSGKISSVRDALTVAQAVYDEG